MVRMKMGQENRSEVPSVHSGLREPLDDAATGVEQTHLFSRSDRCHRIHAVSRRYGLKTPRLWNRRAGAEERDNDVRLFPVLGARRRTPDGRANARSKEGGNNYLALDRWHGLASLKVSFSLGRLSTHRRPRPAAKNGRKEHAMSESEYALWLQP